MALLWLLATVWRLSGDSVRYYGATVKSHFLYQVRELLILPSKHSQSRREKSSSVNVWYKENVILARHPTQRRSVHAKLRGMLMFVLRRKQTSPCHWQFPHWLLLEKVGDVVSPLPLGFQKHPFRITSYSKRCRDLGNFAIAALYTEQG